MHLGQNETEQEMEKVVGKLSENGFIKQQQEELSVFAQQVEAIITQYK